MDRKTIIGMRIKEIREKKRIEKAVAAERLDVGYSTYSNWEAGNREPSAEMLNNLATFYGVSLDYLYGRDMEYDLERDKEIKSGPFADVISEFKKTWSERDRTVKVKIYWYEKLLEEAEYNPNRVNFVLNRMIANHYKHIEEEYQKELKKLEMEEALEDYYNFLDQLLKATKKGSIMIGITNGRVGRETGRDIYRILDYDISLSGKYLSLKLERDEEEWLITFSKIKDIKFSDCGSKEEGRMKIWIYMENETWRFYLNYKVSDVQSSS